MSRPRLLHVVPLTALALGVGLAAAAPASAAASGTFTATGSMHATHTEGKATLLHDGQVLISGANGGGGAGLPSPELYNPATGTWSVTGQMNTPRTDAATALLQNGQVLAAGGSGGGSFPLSSAELYNPATGQWSNASNGLGLCNSNMECRYNSTATLLPTGNVLLAGGLTGLVSNPQTTAGALLYNPGTNTWATTGSMTTARESQTATPLPDGQVLMAGGTLFDHPSPGHPGVLEILASAELYTP